MNLLRIALRAAVRHPLAIILCGAIALRLCVLWSQPLHQPANDEIEYITVARDLLAGRGWAFYAQWRWLRAPLYPLFLAASLWLAGGDLYRAALLNVALSTLNVWLAARVARTLAGPRAALIAATLTALLWTNVTFAGLYMAETLFTTLLSLAILALLRAADPGATMRVGLRFAITAGICCGLAALTRSVILSFLPFAAIWLLWRLWPEPRRAILAAVIFLTAFGGVILPWTVRNTFAYGSPILIETGLSYNMWAFNEPREDLDTINRVLEAIPNPVDRSAYATARGMARIREDPMILARKVWPNWIYLLRVRPIQDRFLVPNYVMSVELPLFTAALIFDDLLYIVIVVTAIAGIVRIPREHHSARILAVGWIAVTIASMLFTHGEARYRHLLFPMLIPYAAWTLRAVVSHRTNAQESTASARAANGRDRTTDQLDTDVPSTLNVRKDRWAWQRDRQLLVPDGGSIDRARWWSHIAIAIPMLLVTGTIATHYPWRWASENVARGWFVLIGDAARARGDLGAARWAYEQAVEAQRAPDPWLRLGDVARAQGDIVAAGGAYRTAIRAYRMYIPAFVRYGDFLRANGDLAGAREAFIGDYADAQQMIDTCWRMLQPAPVAAIDVGNGLDCGYIAGMYAAERVHGVSARWTNGRGLVRLSAETLTTTGTHAAPSDRTGNAAVVGIVGVTARLAAPWPTPHSVPVNICAGSRCIDVAIDATWRIYHVPLPVAAEEILELRSPSFTAPDGRQLGIIVDSVRAISGPTR